MRIKALKPLRGPGTGGMGATLPRAGRMGVVLGLGAPYSRAQRATSAFLPRAHKLTLSLWVLSSSMHHPGITVQQNNPPTPWCTAELGVLRGPALCSRRGVAQCQLQLGAALPVCAGAPAPLGSGLLRPETASAERPVCPFPTTDTPGPCVSREPRDHSEKGSATAMGRRSRGLWP